MGVDFKFVANLWYHRTRAKPIKITNAEGIRGTNLIIKTRETIWVLSSVGRATGCLPDLTIFHENIHMNSKQIGNITELETMLAFIKLGYNVLTPYGDCERYDFVVDAKEKFIKVQCKTSKSTDDGASFQFSGRSSNRKAGKIVRHLYTKEEIDYFVTSFNGKCYLVPVEECGVDKRLRILPPKNDQTRGITWAKDYELEEVVKNW